MSDTHRCRDCEALITQEWDLCEDCHSDWIKWLEERDASLHGRTLDTAASHPSP